MRWVKPIRQSVLTRSVRIENVRIARNDNGMEDVPDRLDLPREIRTSCYLSMAPCWVVSRWQRNSIGVR